MLDLLDPPHARRRRLLVVAVVVATALAAAGVGWVWHSAVARVSGANCPGSQRAIYQNPVVPATPTVGSFGPGLVPDRGPTTVLLCEYRDAGASLDDDITRAVVPLARHALVDGDTTAVSGLLAQLEGAAVVTDGRRTCVGPISPRNAPYLVGLRYDDGTVWVSTPGACGGSTNGVAGSPTDLSGDVRDALDRATGTEPSPPDPTIVAPPVTDPTPTGPRLPLWSDPCSSDDGPSFHDVVVPWPPVSLRVCHLAAGAPANLASPVAADHPAPVAAALAAHLNGLPEDPIGGCGDPSPHEQWVVVFTNASGDRAEVSIDAGTCPDVFDGFTDHVPDAAVFARLRALQP